MALPNEVLIFCWPVKSGKRFLGEYLNLDLIFCVEFRELSHLTRDFPQVWEENKSCYKLSKCTKWHLFHSKLSKLSSWVKTVVILSVAQLVTTVIFFSSWDKSRVKWDNVQNSTQKMRTLSSGFLQHPVKMPTFVFFFLNPNYFFQFVFELFRFITSKKPPGLR